MRYTAILAAVLTCSVIFLTNSPKVSAQAENGSNELISTDVLTLLDKSSLAEKLASKDQGQKHDSKEKAVKYVVSEGDTLVSIADFYQVDWKRIFNKNESITDPNILEPGITIIIPNEDEELSERVSKVSLNEPKTASSGTQTQPVSWGSSAGNSYAYGYCTWYAKQMRPDLPNQMGDAISWVSSAIAMGIPTGSTPRAGAIGQSGNHVVYVEKVNKNGTITISDMNYAGRGVVTTRIVSANSHYYIY